jgi:phosphohistidine phosphatase SixA
MAHLLGIRASFAKIFPPKFMIRILVIVLFASILLSTASAQSTIFIVRHGEKATDASKDPELSAAGRARAEVLARMLKDFGITAIYATEFRRTQETAAPLAAILQLKVTVIPARDTAALAAKFDDEKAKALVVGHTNTIPGLIKALGIQGEPEIREDEYDNLFIVVLSEERPHLIRLRYGSK